MGRLPGEDWVLLPRYPYSLDAMHEVENKIPEDNSLYGKVAYNNILMRVCGSHAKSISASSEQRSEAFCRMMWPDKWK